MKPSILIAGIGNIFLGDDAFGVSVVRTLQKRHLSDGVVVKDFGIRSFDLAYALLDPWEAVVVVDALPRGETPGTLYVIEPDLRAIGHPATATPAMERHSIDPERVLTLAASMGTIAARVLIVGCEPRDFGNKPEGRIGLSAPLQAAVETTCDLVHEIVVRILIEYAEKKQWAA